VHAPPPFPASPQVGSDNNCPPCPHPPWPRSEQPCGKKIVTESYGHRYGHLATSNTESLGAEEQSPLKQGAAVRSLVIQLLPQGTQFIALPPTSTTLRSLIRVVRADLIRVFCLQRCRSPSPTLTPLDPCASITCIIPRSINCPSTTAP
jgi:hypothetical protein